MGLTVTVLGCSGSYPGPGGACSGYLIGDGDTTVWVDAGSGTLANLQRLTSADAVDAVVLTHEHPDHWTDIEGFHNILRFVTGRKGVPVFAPAGLRDRTYGPTEPWLAWTDVADGHRVTVGSLSMSFSRTDHPPETLAVRVDAGGRSVGYSSDTGPGWSLEALGEGLDLALCEATLPAEKKGELAHLTAGQAGATARAAGVGQLVLTHLWPTLDAEQSRAEGAAAFGKPVEVASVGSTFHV
ncbi:MAG: MBL fold metallo-hydrolase [Acidimicrobiales bacterium]